MNIESRPQPDGQTWQHIITAHSAGRPADHFTDSLLDLERLSAGPTYGLPMVTAWETNGGYDIEVTLWSESPEPSADEVAALEGTLAEVLASISF